MIFNHSPHKIIIWAVIAIVFECEWEKEVADHGYVSANASRPEVLMGSNFSAFRQVFFAEGFWSRIRFYLYREFGTAEIYLLLDFICSLGRNCRVYKSICFSGPEGVVLA